MISKYLSPGIFVLALLCFFLPWINISCQGQKIVSMTGFQLSTGTSFQQPKVFGQSIPQVQGREARKVKGEPVAILSLIITILGIIAGFLKGAAGRVGSLAAGGIGALLLIILRYRISGEASKIAVLIQIDYGIGYYIAFLFFLAAIVCNVFIMKGGIPSIFRTTSPRSSSPVKFCTQCGERNPTGNTFCNSCGTKF